MNTFTRRSFLKGLLATAALVNVPVELIERVIIDDIPELPITKHNPFAWLKINGLIVPTNYISFSQSMGDITPIFSGIYPEYTVIDYGRGISDLSELEFGTNKDYFFNMRNEEVTFEVMHDQLPFSLKGNGYFSVYTYQGNILEQEESFDHVYTISGVLEGYQKRF